MSSFLFEKDQINCACFESGPQNVPKVFRFQPQHTPKNGSKSSNETPVKFQTPKTKLKKKSLKKQKPFDPSLSPNSLPFSDQNLKETLLPEIQIKNGKKQLILTDFELILILKPQEAKTQRSKVAQNFNIVNFPSSFASQQFLVPSIGKSHNYPYSYRLVAPNYNEQYDKLVQQEFKKDLDELKSRMQLFDNRKNPQDSKGKGFSSQNQDFNPTPSIKILESNFKQQNPMKQDQNSLKQIVQLKKYHSYTKSPVIQHSSQARHPLDQMNSLQLIPEQKMLQKSLHDLTQIPDRKQRKNSFRSSTIFYKQKQFQDCKIKQRMYAKEIESEKDGSSEDQSEKMSEVVGRGWDGLTEQKQEMQELDDLMLKKISNHSQTMITQQSHIRNSQIKTFTDYSSSFISPKSHKTKAMQTSTAFGGGVKYGIGLNSISYQNIDDLQRLKNSAYGKLHF